MNNKGVTLIELLVSMSIGSILIIITLSLVISGLKLSERINDDIEVQQHGVFSTTYMLKKITHAQNVYSLKGRNGIRDIDSKEQVELGTIVLKTNESDFSGYTFNIKSNPYTKNYSLKYGESLYEMGSIEIGNFIESIKVNSLPYYSSYSNAKGLEFIFKIKKDNASVILRKKAYFKNFKK
ncbi:N-terminal methylation site-containing protein, prepilin-type [Gottschalkia purinilytica]|uniref:N-terminal methylation site-containing protein, prepilin-type n=1 Tax=Gottschalkia purinilytica TaxID=1503 RepID=A0A0L0W7D9_GOTPU|nr:prepilin-type N-terminal cleavage/methylation domain-containing protein [Gottschalkia purinilytica]KNF07387.1 N-terminal methylation site-containing protein, prepilin-type [Gottschalkia purinilytica]